MSVLPASFYDRPVLEVAPALLGCVVAHGATRGVIVETEAYHFSEPACHAYVGVTPRTGVLHGPPGTAYVYRSYGIHALLNAVCEPEGVGAAVLIRALEPLAGVAEMIARRRIARRGGPVQRPGQAHPGAGDRAGRQRHVADRRAGADPGRRAAPVRHRPAVGITKAAELPWRFAARGSRGVSRPWPPGLLA